jgi:branched-chain amino acid transport system substrate-binding protein
MAAFAARYRKRYGMAFQTYAPYAYDATMTFVAAMRAAGSSDPATFLPVLARIKYQGITGTIAFDANGDLRDAALTLYTYRRGQLTRLRVVRDGAR